MDNVKGTGTSGLQERRKTHLKMTLLLAGFGKWLSVSEVVSTRDLLCSMVLSNLEAPSCKGDPSLNDHYLYYE